MPNLRLPAILVLLTITLALAGCAKSPYWVKGLTLPPGSSVVSQTETASTADAPPMMMPFMGEMEKMLVVSFNCTGGWSSVSAHVDSCMSRAGYADSVKSLGSMAGGLGGSEMDMLDGMRMYSKSDSDYAVMLMDMKGMSSAAGVGGTGMPGIGDFMLSVIKTK